MIDTSKLNQTIWAIDDPTAWSMRSSDRVTLATPLFIEFDESDKSNPKARLLDINGGIDPDWSPLSHFQATEQELSAGNYDECFLRINDQDIPLIEQALSEGDPARAACILMASMAEHSDNWANLIDELEEGRYEPSAWFERDNKQLTLLDLFSGKYVVDLSGEDVESAIESGYLSTPRHPRPSDSDWHNPLLEYGRSQGIAPTPQDLLITLRAQSNRSRMNEKQT